MKKSLTLIALLFLCAIFAGRVHAGKNKRSHHRIKIKARVAHRDTLNTDTISSYNLVYFAQSLIGVPYREASSDPSAGFDCSGFVSYVFKNFDAEVPRSSPEYAGVGHQINVEDALPGDILLFTGTKSHNPNSIGHVAIVYSHDGNKLRFIHSTSGKKYGVTISEMDDTYQRRFVKAVRLLRQNDLFQAQVR